MHMGGLTGERATVVRCPFTVSVGALIVGALLPADRHNLLAHLRDCARCKEEVVALAPLPGLLRRVLPRLDHG
jgi:hypothetical protein